jgi:aminopeptidase-like protein
MRALDSSLSADARSIGHESYKLVKELYPICRSITGNGVRQTLSIIAKYIPIRLHEVPTGTRVFDWTIPKEWNIRDAYIKNSKGERVVDFQKSNLHVLSYSVPVHTRLQLEALKKHLHTVPEHPDWIPYRTSYYNETWGFCLSHNQMLALQEDEYEVLIDSTLEDGSLTYGEYYLRGRTEEEILISTHVCHPSLCNDNLSGIAIVTLLAQHLSKLSPRYSYRFIFAPGTIGSITWLSINESRLSAVKHGLVVALVGHPGNLTYKKSRQGNAEIDRAVSHTMKHAGANFEILDFSPYGYDERQFCSPGIDLPVGRLTRTPNNCYPEYHTSADNLELVRVESLVNSFFVTLASLEVLERNVRCVNRNPKCEPQLGKRGLYRTIGNDPDREGREHALLWVLNLSDGAHSLLDIAERSGLPFHSVKEAADLLSTHDLLDQYEK